MGTSIRTEIGPKIWAALVPTFTVASLRVIESDTVRQYRPTTAY